MTDLARRLAVSIPDTPEWIDIRGMLLSPHGQVTGGDSVETGFVVRVTEGAVSAVGVVGAADRMAIRRSVADVTALTPVVCQTDAAAHVRSVLAGWTEERAIVHTLPVSKQRIAERAIVSATVRLLRPDEAPLLAHLPPGLRHEMTAALVLGPVASAFEDARPVAFCYPVWRTESWWDVSIDTLEPYRRRGLAFAAVQRMTDEMRAVGLEPIWSALVSNTPSLRLAAKIGFTPVAGITVFSRDGRWTLFSGGYKDEAELDQQSSPR